MARQNGCAAVATAHHKDDLAETVIHRLMRGTGFRGLCGIRPVSIVYGGVFILVLSILGFVKALAGESFRIPVLEDYAEKIPVGD